MSSTGASERGERGVDEPDGAAAKRPIDVGVPDLPPGPDYSDGHPADLPPTAFGEDDDPFADFSPQGADYSLGVGSPAPGARAAGSRSGAFDRDASGGRRSGSGGRTPRHGGGFPRDGGLASIASRLAAARMPPHSIEAEQSLLGCLMVTTTEGFDKVSDLVAEQDFYQENHRLIWRAIGALVTDNKQPDVVTVASWLDANGLLGDADGLDYVAALVEIAPSAANVKTYGEIVRERSVLRQMITVANEIADSAFAAEGRTSKELLDEAETKVFAIADQTARTGTGFKDITSVLTGAVERITLLFESDSAITGLETGFSELDEKTSGLQKSDLVIVAGRPSMGKTTFAMNIAEHAAMTADAPVAVFSMEMPAEQLALRLISSLGRVELSKIRTGNLAEQDWPRITSAITMLNQRKNVYIDDTPALTPTDLRARARRLARDRGLSLIVIDYLQLMKVANTKENRATEISEISGSLKALAKELDVPIIALSQLNRSLEQRPDKRPVMSDLRECVTGDTRVALADGRQLPIVELVGQTPDVMSLHDDGRIAPARAEAVWCVGTRPVFEVQLRSGRRLRCTGDHRLRGFEDWIRVKDLTVGDRLAAARRLPAPAETHAATTHELILLAHLIGDGSYLTHQPLRYTTASEANSEAVRAAAEAMGSTVKRRDTGRNWHQLEIGGNGNRWHPAGVGKWLKGLGIWNQRSVEKRVPAFVFALRDEQLAVFLQHLWATDGCVHVSDKHHARVYFTSVSRALVEDAADLLLRFGIVGRIKRVEQGKSHWYCVDVSGADGQRRFAERIGGFGERELQVARLLVELDGKVANTNVDTLPIEVFDHIRATMRERGVTHREMAAARGTAYGGSAHFSFSPSRRTVSDYADRLDDDLLRTLCESDVFWDEVTSITAAGEAPVFDLTVPGTASWLGSFAVNHNSGAIEQDADVIMFIYRDEVYNPEDESNHGKAEILIRKQRNGPIGACNLTFLGKFTRFENFSPEVQGGDF